MVFQFILEPVLIQRILIGFEARLEKNLYLIDWLIEFGMLFEIFIFDPASRIIRSRLLAFNKIGVCILNLVCRRILY